MTGLLLLSTNGLIGLIVGLVVVFVMAFYSLIFLVLVPRQNKKRAEDKRTKHERKMEEAKVKTELNTMTKKADHSIEIEKEALRPRFCRYCGAQHKVDQTICTSCGSKL